MCDCWHICHVRTRSASYQYRMTQYVLAGNVAAISRRVTSVVWRVSTRPVRLEIRFQAKSGRISELSGPLMTIACIDL